MGLSPTGVQVNDVKLAMMGHVKEDYRVQLLQTLPILFPTQLVNVIILNNIFLLHIATVI